MRDRLLDPGRLDRLSGPAQRVVQALLDEGTLSQGDLSDVTGLPAPLIKRAIHELRDADLIEGRMPLREGARLYSLHPHLLRRPDAPVREKRTRQRG